jgi:hypothetical protein
MIKRVVTVVVSGLALAVLGGCPIYGDGRDHRVCVGGDCYECPEAHYSSECTGWTCTSSGDCPSGYTCNAERRCKLGATPANGACTKPSDCTNQNCGADNQCHPGDCSTTGCPSSFVCRLSNGVAQCVAGAPDGGATSTCKSDRDCPTPAGSKCLTGTCVAPQDQCADATQCAASSQCVDGSCTPACNGGKPCPTGYACDLAKGVCTQNPTVCSTSAQCSGGNVCVDEHCVAPCDANGACPAGLVCLDGGCTPEERPVFTCSTEGTRDACQEGSICLRHSCYIACAADAGAGACRSADTFNVCKPVTTSSGSYNVCGSATNLGTECDPTQAKNCPPTKICIDGFCR